MDINYEGRDPAPTVEFVATIRAEVPVWVLPRLWDALTKATPEDGILSVEVDGSRTNQAQQKGMNE